MKKSTHVWCKAGQSKRIVCMLLVLVLSAAFIPAGAEYSPGQFPVMVNGEYISFKTSPVMIEGNAMLPVRELMEIMGGTAEYDHATGAVTLGLGDSSVRLWEGALTMLSGPSFEEHIDLPAAPFTKNGTMLAPAKAVLENLGCIISYDWAEDCVVIIDENSLLKDFDQGFDAVNRILRLRADTSGTFGIKSNMEADIKVKDTLRSYTAGVDMSYDIRARQTALDLGLTAALDLSGVFTPQMLLNMSDEDIEALALAKNIDLDVIFDGESLTMYVRSKAFIKALKIYNEIDVPLDEGTWIKFNLAEMLGIDESISIDDLYEQLGAEYGADITIRDVAAIVYAQSGLYGYYAYTETYSEYKLINNIICALLSDDHFDIEEKNGVTKLRYKLDTETVVSILAEQSKASGYTPTEEEINEALDALELDMELELDITDDTNYAVKLDFTMSFVDYYDRNVTLEASYDGAMPGKTDAAFRIETDDFDLNIRMDSEFSESGAVPRTTPPAGAKVTTWEELEEMMQS